LTAFEKQITAVIGKCPTYEPSQNEEKEPMDSFLRLIEYAVIFGLLF
jgi:hypothetical protein